ncbi:MAG: hypothetical protein EKK57_04200 [Proteobacteria bacterium]|nr:MAG: hypothetical protein EKK57_04200 [Pseudomonadota bacterium]
MKKLLTLFIIFFCLLITSCSTGTTGQSGETLNSITKNESGILVTVGNHGMIQTSSDNGIQWHTQISNTSNNLNGVAYGNKQFIAVGNNTILSSADGTTWNVINQTLNTNLAGIIYSQGKFIAVGNDKTSGNGVILSSLDGSTWKIDYSAADIGALKSVTYGNGKFIVVGISSLLTSIDNGITWTKAQVSIYPLYGVTYGNNKFVAVGAQAAHKGVVVTSAEDNQWTNINTNFVYEFEAITYNGTFVAVGQHGAVYSSTDGITWNKIISGTNGYLYGVTSTIDGKFIAVGSNSTIISLNVSGNNSYHGVTYGNGKFIAVGDKGLLKTSNDGISWITQNSSTQKSLMAVVSGTNLPYIAVGTAGTIVMSPDGVNWATQSSGVSESNLFAITYGNNQYVVVGQNGVILTSPNGITWNKQQAVNNSLYGITYANNLFVAVGLFGSIYTSPDGSIWTQQSSGTDAWLTGISVNSDGEFVVVGIDNNGNSISLTSPDCSTWTTQANNLAQLYGTTYNAPLNYYLAFGYDGTLLSSTNGADWTALSSGTNEDLFAAAVNESGNSVIVGANQTIIYFKKQYK